MAHPLPGIRPRSSKQAPSGVMPSLDWLIHPVAKAVFFEQYWEKRPLVVQRNQPNYYSDLLSLDEIDRAITTLDRDGSQIILKDANRELTSDDYTIDEELDVARVFQLFGEGSTITLAFLEAVLPQLAGFCRGLEKEFTCPFQANIYLTPPGAQGAKAHYDTHDVFVLQVDGSKKWAIYGTPIELPLPGQDFDAETAETGEVTQEFTLEAGDLAYLPRGIVHDARSTDALSLHVTAGVLRYTWTDLLLEFVASASLRDAAFRKSLPPGFARGDFDRGSVRENLCALLKRAAEIGDSDAALEHFAEDFFAKCRPLLRGQMAQLAALEKLTPKSTAGVRPEAIFRIIESGDSVRIDCYGRRITFPKTAAQAVQFALRHEKFVVRELPGALDDEGKLTTVRRLVKEGLAVILDR